MNSPTRSPDFPSPQRNPLHRAPGGRTGGNCLKPAPGRAGFALVVTVSMLVLLAVIAVGLLSLSTLSVRSGSNDSARAEARANARLALMLAIGELQKELGPDQRISARAEILDKDPDTSKIDDVANPNHLGVWNSWDTWLTDRKGSLSIQDTYKRGRDPSLFRAWLVSNRNAGDYQAALGPSPDEDAVQLVGEGSAGEDANNHVLVDRIPVAGSRSPAGGRFAWWVSDEALKARFNLAERNEVDSVEEAVSTASQTGRIGVEKMAGMASLDISPGSLPKMITTGQARISAPAVVAHFHDITASSTGLLTDVRSGGFKSDLNLAFESSGVPEQMDEAELFGGRPFDAPIRPMTGDVAKVTPQNPYIAPMSWRQLREYYRLYRHFSRNSDLHPLTWDGRKPETQRFVMGDRSMQNKWDTAGYTRQPVLLRQTWIIASKTESNRSSPDGKDYYILAIPVVSLWNPYDIALDVDSEEISYFGSMFYAAAMVQRTYRGSQFLGERPFPDETSWGKGARPNQNITANQLGYRMIPIEKSGDIRFEPGEVRIFSTNDEILHGVRLIDSADAMTSRHFFASPGYQPVQDSGGSLLRGLKNQVNPGTGRGDLTFSLRLAKASRTIDPFFVGASRTSTIVFSFQEALAAQRGAYYDDGSPVGKQEWHDVVRLQAFSLDWLTERDMSGAYIVNDSPAGRARFPAPGSPPMPIGIFSMVAKSPERLVTPGRGDFTADFRNRGWLHAPVTGMGAFLMNPTNLNRADSPYQIHFTPVNGDQEVSRWLQADERNGYFGGGFTPATGQTHVTALDLPVTPIVNLGSFAGARMSPARARIDQRDDNFRNPSVDSSTLPGRGYHNLKHQAHAGGAFGAGIGNAYAHPMVEPSEVYTRNRFGDDKGWDGSNATNLPLTDDYWDHLFLANEGLWDSWFCSGIAPMVTRGSMTTPKETIAEDFFSSEETPMSRHFQPYLSGNTPEELADLVEVSSSPSGENGWDKIAAHILNKGQFNANSTSKEAWKALLMSLSNRPLALNEAGTGTSIIAPETDEISLVRHLLANSPGEASGPDDPDSWQSGIRKLTENQIDKLAGEIVRQVKLRGPFLNMTEFINRRLTEEVTGVTGALQAAIDWDEFNSGYNGSTSGSGESINGAYKTGESMISSLPADYPNEKAATGSRYAGIPGYVMQSDLLQGLGTSLTVRGDTFLIRAYGESLDSTGEVVARAWCEATLQRLPEYVDPEDAADKKLWDPANVPGGEPDLVAINRKFGRKFAVVAFRWLQKEEV